MKLNTQVKIYIPSTVNVSEDSDNTEYRLRALTLLSSHFGGATSVTGVGGWLSESGELVLESVDIVSAFCTKSDCDRSLEAIRDFCRSMKESLNQEAVALEVNNELELL